MISKIGSYSEIYWFISFMVVEMTWEEKDFGIVLNEAFQFLRKKKFDLKEINNDKEWVGIEFKNRWRSETITFHLAPETDIVYR
jgi:hypothetical protein